MTHVATVEPDHRECVGSESQNGTILHHFPPGTELFELVPDIVDAPPSLPVSSPIPKSTTELAVCRDRLDLGTPETGMPRFIIRQLGLGSLYAPPTLPFLLVVGTASICLIRLVVPKERKQEIQIEGRTKDASRRRRARRPRREKCAVHGVSALQESATLESPQPSLEELEGNTLELTDEIVRGSFQVEGATFPTTPAVHDANKCALLEMLNIPALWELIFAGSLIPSALPPYAQLKLAAAARVVIIKGEAREGAGPGRDFSVEELVYGVYVVGETLEGCPGLAPAEDMVWTWLSEREEARAWEQCTELGIVWARPPRV